MLTALWGKPDVIMYGFIHYKGCGKHYYTTLLHKLLGKLSQMSACPLFCCGIISCELSAMRFNANLQYIIIFIGNQYRISCLL